MSWWVPIGVVLALVVAISAVTAFRGSSVSLASGAEPGQLTVSQGGPPLDVSYTTPSTGATAISTAATVAVHFSAPVSSSGPMPSLSPAVPGKWAAANAYTLQFTPSTSFAPGMTETLTVPGGPSGIHGADGGYLRSSLTATFTIESGSILRLQQLLAQLGYMPLSFVPSGPAPSALDEAGPAQGSFAWRWPNIPSTLGDLWQPGQPNLITTGALMAFEHNAGLTDSKAPNPQAWAALLSAVQNGRTDPNPYSYIYVSKTLPENLTLWINGSAYLSSLTNTGIAGARTPDGTFPVYLRYTYQVMRGTNPNGSHYADGVHWINYFYQSDAVHGFPRASYGFPQSVGCVELPISTADVVFHHIGIGTLVTITP